MLETIYGILWFVTVTLLVVLSVAGAYYMHKYRDAEIPFLEKHEDDIRRWLILSVVLALGAYGLSWMRSTFPVHEQWHIGGAVLIAFVTMHLIPLGVWLEHKHGNKLTVAELREENWIGTFYGMLTSLVFITLFILYAAYTVEGDMAFMYQLMVGLVSIFLIAAAYGYWAQRMSFREVGDEWAKKRPFVTGILIVGTLYVVPTGMSMLFEISKIIFALICVGVVVFILHSAWLKKEEEYIEEQKSAAASDLAVQIYMYLLNEYDVLPDCKNIEENGDMIRIVLAMNGPEERARLGSWVCDDIRDKFGFGRVELTCVSGDEGGDTEEQIVLELRTYYKGEDDESTT